MEMPKQKSLSYRLTEIRISLNMTQKEFAKYTGSLMEKESYCPSLVSAWELGRRAPDEELKRRLETTLNLKKGYLTDVSDKEMSDADINRNRLGISKVLRSTKPFYVAMTDKNQSILDGVYYTSDDKKMIVSKDKSISVSMKIEDMNTLYTCYSL